MKSMFPFVTKVLGFTFFVTAIQLTIPSVHASSWYWRTGDDVGSNWYWRTGDDVGSEWYWRTGKECGSEWYWRTGKEPSVFEVSSDQYIYCP
ncbi:MAG: hypothetical protein HQK52_24130 [Oligoflexia bacterium]|nr:hypothetical protein [Oligoflexia bacterium]